jgi:hypothetical protein
MLCGEEITLTMELSVKAKIFGDSFPEPFVLEAKMSVEANQSLIDVYDVLPNLDRLLEAKESLILEEK